MSRITLGLLALATVMVGALGAGATPAAQAQDSGDTSAKCATSALVAWLDTRGDAAAGSTYFGLKLTNLSGHACTLLGYPGVSAVDLAGHQLGSAANRSRSQVRVVRLSPGATATAGLQIVDAGNFPSSRCHRVTAAGLRVYPPDEIAAKVVPFPFAACSRKGPIGLNVSAIR